MTVYHAPKLFGNDMKSLANTNQYLPSYAGGKLNVTERVVLRVWQGVYY